MQFDPIGFLTAVFAVLVMVGILSILIIVHEFGHWSVARFFGFQTPIFGFGLPFGPTITLGKKWDTEFKIHYAMLVGGYVAIPELGDESNATEENLGVRLKPFRKFPVWQRMLVAFAGVFNNIVFAWLVMLVMLLTLGVPRQDVVVHALPAANPIAKEAGIQVNDRIVAINDKKMAAVDDVIQYLGQHKNHQVVIKVFRPDKPEQDSPEGKAGDPASNPANTADSTSPDTEQSGEDQVRGSYVDVPVTPNQDGKVGMALVGKGKMSYQKVEGSLPEVAWLSGVKLWNLTWSMLDTIGMMFQNIFSGGGQAPAGGAAPPKMGIDDLHGVLAVVKIGADIAQRDWTQLFLFTIMISMDLAIINLLPIPALDGGHLAFMTFEALRGKPMEERIQTTLVKWGFVSLLLLMAVIMVNDIRALVTGQLDIKVKSDKPKNEQKTGPPERTGTPSDKPEDKNRPQPAGAPP